MLRWALMCVLLHATHPMDFGPANFSSFHNDCNSTQCLHFLNEYVLPPRPINMELGKRSTSPWSYEPYVDPNMVYGDGRLLQAQCKNSDCGEKSGKYLSKPINLSITVLYRRPGNGTQYHLKFGRISIAVGCTCVLAR